MDSSSTTNGNCDRLQQLFRPNRQIAKAFARGVVYGIGNSGVHAELPIAPIALIFLSLASGNMITSADRVSAQTRRRYSARLSFTYRAES